MSVTFYDRAVKNKIKKLFNNTEYQSRELTFKTITDREGKVSFPYISIFRPDGWSISSSNSWLQEKFYVQDIRQVFVDLSYQIDIYANTREDLEEISVELVLYLLRNPGITVTYYSADKSESTTINTYLKYVSGPERTSELDDETKGRPYRHTLVFSLENAMIFDYASDNPDSPDYVPIVTEIIVGLALDNQYLLEIDAEGNSKITDYKIKEELLNV